MSNISSGLFFTFILIFFFLQFICCIKWSLYMYVINGWCFFSFFSIPFMCWFDLSYVNIMSNTFIAEVSYPARCTSKITQTIDIIASTTRVDAFLRTILTKKSMLATWWKQIKSYMFLNIMTYLLHCISTWILLKNELVHLHIDIHIY